MEEQRELICIGCPIGCMLEVSLEKEKVMDVKGYSCKKGKIYGEKECTHPTRIFTSSVKVKNGQINVVSVKTEFDIPKDRVMKCIEELRELVVDAPIYTGDVILRNVAGTKVNIIATKEVSHL